MTNVKINDNTGKVLLIKNIDKPAFCISENNPRESSLVYNLRILKPSHKDIMLDTLGSDSFFDTTEQVISLKVSAKDNRRLLVFIFLSGDNYNSLSSVTHAGKKLTRLIGLNSNFNDSRIEFWDLISPEIGTHDLIIRLKGKTDYLNVGYAVIYNASQKNNIILNSCSTNSKNAYTSVTPILDNCWAFSMSYPKNKYVKSLKGGNIFMNINFACAAYSSHKAGDKITHIYKGFNSSEKWIWAMIAVPPTTIIIDRLSRAESERLSDNFDDNQVDAKWIKHETKGGSLFEKNGCLCFKLKNNKRVSWAGIQSKKTFDFRGCYAQMEIVYAQKGDTWLDLILSQEKLPSNNFIIIGVDVSGKRNNAGVPALTALLQVNGVDHLLAVMDYDPAIHRYVRMREHCGTVFFEWSADGIRWNELYNMSNPFDMSSLYLIVDDFAYSNESKPDVHIVDNLKIVSYENDCFVNVGTLSEKLDTLLNVRENLGFKLENIDKLEKGKYYCKVRSRDLSGNGRWSNWSTTEIFEII